VADEDVDALPGLRPALPSVTVSTAKTIPLKSEVRNSFIEVLRQLPNPFRNLRVRTLVAEPCVKWFTQGLRISALYSNLTAEPG
jgi:hypothetical protein